MGKNTDTNPVWDIPTRLFHWLLVISMFVAWFTFDQGYMDTHAYCGYFIFSMVLFRILWGFVGSQHSRFSEFITGPKKLISYIQGKPEPEHIGHNPLGALSVIVLLGSVLIQAITGLFNGDDILFDGPYRSAIESEWADQLSAIHAELFYIILGFVALHIAAVMYYDLIKRKGLIQAMLTGRKKQVEVTAKPTSIWLALLVFCLSVGAITLLIYLAPTPEYYY